MANRLSGNGAANQLSGGSGDDTLVAGAGNDTLTGGAGLDSLVGEAGQDSFLFDTVPATANADIVVGFSAADDTFMLDNAVFVALGAATGPLAAAQFRAGTAAADADDRVIYDAASGQLFYDADGNGAGSAVLFAQLSRSTAVSAADFVIV
jgi:Ca2+-binding RTX toxin-like protein